MHNIAPPMDFVGNPRPDGLNNQVWNGGDVLLPLDKSLGPGTQLSLSPGQPDTLPANSPRPEGGYMALLSELWADDRAQDIAEYAVMLAAILVIVIGTLRLIGSNANTAFSAVASSLQ
jgi:Flp pilus assembly pilin Flp